MLKTTMTAAFALMTSGGSAGLRTMIALPRLAPPTDSIALAVVSVNSSIFALVPGPAESDAIDATIERLRREKWLDDDRYAAAYTRTRVRKGIGR